MQSGGRLERQVRLDQDAELASQLIGRPGCRRSEAPGSELAVVAGRFDNRDRSLPARRVRDLDENSEPHRPALPPTHPLGVPGQVVEIPKSGLHGYQ